jgi:hypothetical protein
MLILDWSSTFLEELATSCYSVQNRLVISEMARKTVYRSRE